MEKLLLIDGNSIINRAFYGIMGNKMLMTEDGTYTNAVYGFLAILFKELEDIKPEYLGVAFDLKAPTNRHKLYKEYKANRKGMPNELAQQMPILKEILEAMNIKIIEKEGYEADDILGTLATHCSKENLEAIILTGDRDSFQLINKNIKVRISRTKQGKTETEDYTEEKILEEYEITPKQLIELKGLMGDSSDNIPGVPGIGQKTGIELIKTYKNLEGVYNNLDKIKGKQKEKLQENRELAFLSRTLGIIDVNAEIEKDIASFRLKDWDKANVYEIFKKLKFNRYIERFDLLNNIKEDEQQYKIEYETTYNLTTLINEIREEKRLYYYISTENKNISKLVIFNEKQSKAYLIKKVDELKDIFEDADILKIRI